MEAWLKDRRADFIEQRLTFVGMVSVQDLTNHFVVEYEQALREIKGYLGLNPTCERASSPIRIIRKPDFAPIMPEPVLGQHWPHKNRTISAANTEQDAEPKAQTEARLHKAFIGLRLVN